MLDLPIGIRRACKKLGAGLLDLASRGLMQAWSAIWQLQVKTQALKYRKFEYEMRPDDIFIVTYPRSGTTWLQMTLYQLLSDGSMEVEHINGVAPYFEMPPMSGIPDLPSPRIYKTHLSYSDIPKGKCRYIYMFRDGADVALSYYHMHKDILGYEKDFSGFFEEFMRGTILYGSWFAHVQEWWAHRDELNILFLRYEDMLKDQKTGILQIAEFLGLALSEDKLQDVLGKTDFAFMKRHEMKFDAAMAFLYDMGMKPSRFIRGGKSGVGGASLSEREAADFRREARMRFADAGLDFLIPDSR
jgi:hypothetical protein